MRAAQTPNQFGVPDVSGRGVQDIIYSHGFVSPRRRRGAGPRARPGGAPRSGASAPTRRAWYEPLDYATAGHQPQPPAGRRRRRRARACRRSPATDTGTANWLDTAGRDPTCSPPCAGSGLRRPHSPPIRSEIVAARGIRGRRRHLPDDHPRVDSPEVPDTSGAAASRVSRLARRGSCARYAARERANMSGVDNSVDGHVVIVTGGSKGVGRGIALHLAQHGASRRDHRPPPGGARRGCRPSSRRIGAPHLATTLNVADRDGAFALVEQTVAEFGTVDAPRRQRADVPLGHAVRRDHRARHGRAAGHRAQGHAVGDAGGVPAHAGAGPRPHRHHGLQRRAARRGGVRAVRVVEGGDPRAHPLRRTASGASSGSPSTACARCRPRTAMPPGDEDPVRAKMFAETYANQPIPRDGDAVDDIGPVVQFLRLRRQPLHDRPDPDGRRRRHHADLMVIGCRPITSRSVVVTGDGPLADGLARRPRRRSASPRCRSSATFESEDAVRRGHRRRRRPPRRHRPGRAHLARAGRRRAAPLRRPHRRRVGRRAASTASPRRGGWRAPAPSRCGRARARWSSWCRRSGWPAPPTSRCSPPSPKACACWPRAADGSGASTARPSTPSPPRRTTGSTTTPPTR